MFLGSYCLCLQVPLFIFPIVSPSSQFHKYRNDNASDFYIPLFLGCFERKGRKKTMAQNHRPYIFDSPSNVGS